MGAILTRRGAGGEGTTEVLALAATNAVGVVLFAAVYAVGGARLLPQMTFLGCLGIIFLIVATLWVWVERRHRALDPLARLGRAVGALVIVLLAVPALALMPVFWLDTQLPEAVGFRRYLGPLMMLTLVSLVLVVCANATGALILVGRALLGQVGAERR
jgi:hypothetical protein